MSPIATYSFLPWLRQGVANTITSADMDPSVHTRASVHVELQLSGDPIGGGTELTAALARDVQMYGPSDVIGIDSRAVVRTEPANWITNFEANYLPAVDFYDEDFPWRYTPATADPAGLRLRPWITLIALSEDEFDEGSNLASRPSPCITVADASVFPPAPELWAWAHVHVNDLLSAGPAELVAPDMAAVLPRLHAVLAANRDAAYSRLLCPRLLRDNTGYHAFVVPTFETGRLAGLGLDPTGAPHATFSAWASYPGRPETGSYPVYYRWFFQTGTHGDFEYLVRLLKPQPVDTRVGTRDMDVAGPGSNLPGITKPELGGILRLGGALQVPDADLGPADLAARQRYENWDQPYPDDFQRALAAFVNLPDDYAAQEAAAANAASGLGPGVDDDPDPLITAPLYGQWHALTQRLLTQRDGSPSANSQNWVHRLNLDPRFRVPAGFGAQVVEANAESYLDDAWQQIGDVLDANARIRRLHLAAAVSTRWYDAHLAPLLTANPERALSVLAPVSQRILVSGATLAHTRSASLVPPVLTSTAMRRVTRPGARLMRSLPYSAAMAPGSTLLARVNAGQISAAPPKVVPPAVPTVDEAAAAAAPGVPGWAAGLLSRFPRLPLIGLLLAIGILVIALALLAVAAAAAAAGIALAVALGVASWLLRRWQISISRDYSIEEAGQTPASVDALPKSPDFTLTVPGSGSRPSPGPTDSPTASRFKDALRDSYAMIGTGHAISARQAAVPLALPEATAISVAAVNPSVTIPKRGLSMIAVPPWIRELIGDTFDEIMAYPRIDLPMYRPLKEISVELLLPSINRIAQNSITLIETNQRFIEAYLVGLNHEFARKLLWREYPTDQRGSYFRQFWDVSSYIDSEGLSEDPLREKLYDIPELHRWPLTSALGTHNNRQPADPTAEQAVLVVRGELLKKYPNALIYAQRAQWAMNGTHIDLTKPRDLVPLSGAEEAAPPHDKLRSPLYEATAEPDIYFFGFDLTIEEARGGSGEHDTDDPGWFFVLQQRPGEPRFGLELGRDGVLDVFDELVWDDAIPAAQPGQFLPAGSLGTVPLVPPNPPEAERQQQHDDDEQVDPAASSSARWAYLLYRAPILVAVHADEMLGQAGS